MTNINLLNEHLIDELCETLNMESQWMEVMPNIVHATQALGLRNIMEDLLRDTKEQSDRILDIFKSIMQGPKVMSCNTVKEMIQELQEEFHKYPSGRSLDIEIIKTTLRVHEFGIIKYQTVCDHATDLGHTLMMSVLNISLNEKKAMNFRLNELFQGMINEQALHPKKRYFIRPKRGRLDVPEESLRRKRTGKKHRNSGTSFIYKEPKVDLQDN